jgi:uncharacterized protein YbjT (DUF2867 family)
MTETVLVIGGTGELGAPAARQLRRDGYRVRLLVGKPTGTRDRDAALEYVQGDLDSTIFRPTYFMETLPRQVRGGRAVVLGRQPHPFHLIAATDFARMVSRALATPESAGKRLDVHGPQALTIADALRIYCQQLAPGTRVVTFTRAGGRPRRAAATPCREGPATSGRRRGRPAA